MKRISIGFLVVVAMVVATASAVRHVVIRRAAVPVEADTLPTSQVFRARLLFAGDVMAHLPQVTAAHRNGCSGRYDFSRQFEYVKPLFAAADRVIVNLETTLSPDGPYTGYPAFRTPDELAYALRDAGVDMAVLANNHCCDRGKHGIRSTLAALDNVGIRHTGAFIDTLRHGADHPLRFEVDGIRFALFSYTYGTNGLPVPAGATVNRIDTVMMARDLAAVDRTETDCVVVCMHWGTEYERRPNRGQRMLAAFLRRHGADLIVGSHPHVIQPYECDSIHAVFYSLGNFVSNQRRRYCDGGLLAGVEVIKRVGTHGRMGACDDSLCRSVSMRYAVRAIPVWVALPDYRILPPEVGDTITLSPVGRAAYERFMADTEELLQKGI